MRRNPLKRALRADKLTLAALSATLALYRSSPNLVCDLPIIGLLARPMERIELLAQEAAALLREALPLAFAMKVIPSDAEVGSGAQPTFQLPSRAVAITRDGWSPERIAALFRAAEPAILGRIARDHFLLDVRAVTSAADLVPHSVDTGAG
jgi:L-seryl-tRNA(Ser) seleniumtransferase